MMNIKRIITLFCLLMISLLSISACDSGTGRGGSYTVVTNNTNLADVIRGGTINYDDNTIINEDGEVVAYINRDNGTITNASGYPIGSIDYQNNITNANGEVIGYVDGDGNIVISGEEEETDTSEEKISYTLDDNVLSAFSEEFITHFKAGNNSITSTDDTTITNIEYILTALANNGIDNVTSDNLSSAFGRIVAEKVSSESCDIIDGETTSLGCALLDIISSDSTTFQNSLDGFIGNSEDYASIFETIISNLANLNSQNGNIEGLADVLETAVNDYGDKDSLEQKIKNQLSYIASYITYTTVKLYCNLNSDINCNDSSANGYFKIYTESNTTKINFCYNNMLLATYSSGTCSNSYELDDKEIMFTLNQDAISDVESFVNDNLNLSWNTTNGLNESYDAYMELYNNVGNMLVKECDNVTTHSKLYYKNAYESWSNTVYDYTHYNTRDCSFTEGHGNKSDDLKSLINSINTLAISTYSNAYNTPINDIAGMLSYIASAPTSNTITTLLLMTSDYGVTHLISRSINFGIDIASLMAGYSYYALLSTVNLSASYSSTLSETEVSDAGRRNIYYFITEFINGLDNNGDESYLTSYSFNEEKGYKAYTLPADMKSEESDENDFYYNLSLAFMTNTNSDNNKSISMDNLNTTNDNKDNSTAGFTYASEILNDTKEYVIDILKDYEVIMEYIEETEEEGGTNSDSEEGQQQQEE